MPYPRTDVGNATRLVDDYGHLIRYCRDIRCWYAWDGTRWAEDPEGIAVEQYMVKVINESLREDVEQDEQGNMASWWRESSMIGRIRAAVALARGAEEVQLHSRDLDPSPYLLNTPTGVVDLNTSALFPPDPSYYCTRQTKVSPAIPYDPSLHPVWTRVLEGVTIGDKDMEGWLQRLFGLCATGMANQRAAFVFTGSGGNGKSTLLNAVLYALGSYAAKSPAETFIARKNGGSRNGNASPDIARLFGVRMLWVSESEEGEALAEALIKDLTGGDEMVARHLYQGYFQFRPTLKLILATNHPPSISGTDDGIWDRIRMVPFRARFGPSNQWMSGDQLRDALEREAPAILGWVIQGAGKALREGLGTCEVVAGATKAYRYANNSVGQFIAENIRVDYGSFTRCSNLYQAYQRWAMDNGAQVQSVKKLSQTMKASGFEPVKSNGNIIWRDVGLVNLTTEAED